MIYDRPTWQLMEEAVADLKPPFTQRQITDWFAEHYPKLKATSIQAHTTYLTANNRNRRHHQHGKKTPLLFRTPDGLVPYDPVIHGQWNERGERVDEVDDPLAGFSPAVSFTREAVAVAPQGSGVHVVFDENDEVVYVGISGSTRTRLRQHLSGDREGSALHKNLGEELDDQFGESATQADIEEHLSAWSLSWLECPPDEAAARRDALRTAFDPRLHRGRRAPTNIWWVNQGRSFDDEREQGVVFASNGEGRASNPQHWQNVTRLAPGHLVLHYSRHAIRAVGVVTARSRPMTRPYGPAEERDEGNGAAVEYHPLDHPIDLDEIEPRLDTDGPFDRNGGVKQQYLMGVAPAFATRLRKGFADRWPPGTLDRLEQPVPTDLASLIERFIDEEGYPTARDDKFHAAREEMAAELTPAGLDRLQSNPERARQVFNRMAGGTYGSPGNQSTFNRSLQQNSQLARTIDAAQYLLHGDGEVEDRIDAVLTDPARRVSGLAEAMVTKILAIAEPQRWIPNYITVRANGKFQVLDLLDRPQPDRSLSKGHQMAESNDAIREVLEPYFGDDAWGMQEFSWWLLQQQGPIKPPPVDPLGQLAKRLYVPEEFLNKAIRLLGDRRQIVFYGPPGTGKTYIAREVAAHVARAGEVAKVQFHPSYAYEDFVEGYRPRLVDGQATFELVDGPFKEIADAAAQSDEIHVLLIDELNRGNVAKILGELYFLLEYRDEEMRLQYSAAPFSVPDNLWIIATMNTADRSIALVDAALRRRFHFMPFFPDEPPVAGLLRRWLQDNNPAMAHVADLVDHANSQLDNRHLAIGPSHFLRKDLDDDWLELVWEHSVIPYLAEQFFGDDSRLVPFQLKNLRTAMTGATSALTPAAEDLDGDDAALVVDPDEGD